MAAGWGLLRHTKTPRQCCNPNPVPNKQARHDGASDSQYKTKECKLDQASCGVNSIKPPVDCNHKLLLKRTST